MAAPIMTARTAAAPMAVPAIAPVVRPGPAFCITAGVVDVRDEEDGKVLWLLISGVVVVALEVVVGLAVEVDSALDVLVGDSVLNEVVLEEGVVNSDRSASWKATVIGCAHIVIGPETVVTIVIVPSRVELKPPASAKTVVIAALLYILVHPKYSAVLDPALTLLR